MKAGVSKGGPLWRDEPPVLPKLLTAKTPTLVMHYPCKGEGH